MEETMVTYEFQNLSKQNVGFSIYENFVWKSGTTLILKVVDATPVSVRFSLQALAKQASNSSDLIRLLRGIQNIVMAEFPEGSTGYSISFTDPELRPDVKVKWVSPLMEVGDEMTFEVQAINLEGKIVAFIKEQNVAKVLKDGRTIKAVGPGTCNLRVGTREFSREFPLKVEAPAVKDEDKVEVPEEVQSAKEEMKKSDDKVDELFD